MRSLPFFAEISVPHETPRSLYSKLLSDQEFSFLLESGKGPEKSSRYSFLGGNPYRVVKCKGDCMEIVEQGNSAQKKGNPILELMGMLDSTPPDGCNLPPHFWGGCVGFLGYDMLHFFENLPQTCIDDLGLPDMLFLFPGEMVVFDHLKGVTRAVVVIEREEVGRDEERMGQKLLADLLNRIEACKGVKGKARTTHLRRRSGSVKCNQSRREFEECVQRVKRYIREGDIYQANISRRMEAEFLGDPFSLYERLFEINPSPFSSFLRLGELSLVSSSPERLIKVDGPHITTRPIAGTRPRGDDPETDLNMSKELMLSEKERAEHLMLVDLERNDLGRVCRPGSVEVDEFMELESYSHVWHIISNIRGELRQGTGLDKILSACFPGGTITGCPKVRCMEIIDELEPTKRGPYTGSIGYIGYDGRIDLNIIIRTIVLKDNRAFIQVGAGIVADSIPEQEFLETEKKGAAMLEALF